MCQMWAVVAYMACRKLYMRSEDAESDGLEGIV